MDLVMVLEMAAAVWTAPHQAVIKQSPKNMHPCFKITGFRATQEALHVDSAPDVDLR